MTEAFDLSTEKDLQSFQEDLAATRRQFLLGGAAGMAALSAGITVPATAFAQQNDEPPGAKEEQPAELTAADIEGAERVMAVDYTPDQRTAVLENINGQREAMKTIREHAFNNGEAPAPAFDARLPGKDYGTQKNRVRIAKNSPGPLPSSEEDIAFAPLTHLAHWVKTKSISSRDLTGLYLGRIEKYAPRLLNFVTVTTDLAREQAEQADREIAAGNYRGPLHGIPYAVKDLADTAGIRTTWGAEPYKDRIATHDAALVKKLREAGAVLLGKASSGALAFGDVWFGGMTRNPWNTEEGSSGSSAGPGSATAAGLCGFAIGTETLGSIISPANRNGVAGLRPTFGRVSRAGLMALSWSLDKAGPLCRRAEDTALVLAAINGFDAADASTVGMGFDYDGRKDLKDIRIGYIPAAFEGDGISDIDRNALDVARRLGIDLKEITLPDLPYGAMSPIIRAESAAAFDAFTRSGDVDRLKYTGPSSRGTGWRAVRMLSAVDYINMERLRRQVMQAMDSVFNDVDVIIGPNYTANMLMITNYTGHPQLAFRAGFFDTPTRTIFGSVPDENAAKHSVPQDFSVFGRLFGDGDVIRVASALEQAIGVADRRPPLAS